MRETLSKRQKGKAKLKVASARISSKSNSKLGSKNTKKKKELKKKLASSGRSTASVSKQSKISTAKVARKVAKNARIKKAVKKAVKASSRKAASRPVKAQKKVVAKKQVKAKSQARKMAVKKTPVRTGSKARLSSKSRRSVRTAAINSRSKGKVKLPLIVSPPPPPPEPPRRQVTSGALRAFEQAVRAFNRRHFEDAKEMFESVLVKFPGDFEIVARTQMYIQVCKQKLEHEVRPVAPRNADELYDRGVFALNIGDFTQARAFFEKALRLHPDEPHLLYSLAATHAQTGAHEEALDYLKRSIQIQPRFRSQAYNDADFSGLRNNRQFLELIGLTSPFDLLELKR
jgi:tetratricopeptide (TPR) repeat protein